MVLAEIRQSNLQAVVKHIATEIKSGRNGNLAAAIGATNNQPNTIGYAAVNDTNIGAVGGATYVVAGTNIGWGSWNHFTAVVGQTAEDGTLPPYYAVNIWRRIA